jgi:hypothetical protein
MLLVLLLAPLLTGFVRKMKARLVRRQGASVFQPYLDLLRLLRKEVVLADNASWLFRVTPYVTFAAIMTSRLEPMPPKLVPTSIPASARKKRALPSSATMAIKSAVQLKRRPVANVGTRAAATQIAAKVT